MDRKARHHVRVTYPITGTETVQKGPLDRPGDLRAQSLKVPCRACNMGWMKAVQEAAAPILGRLSAGNWFPLTDADKTALAAWATMLTMTYEFADRRTQAASEQERQYLMQHRKPPENWKVWVAEHSGPYWANAINHKGMGLRPDTSSPIITHVNLQSTVFTFGKLLLNTFSTTAEFDIKASEYGLRLGLQTVWPLNGYVIRKPARPHNDKEVEFIANALEWAFDDFMISKSADLSL